MRVLIILSLGATLLGAASAEPLDLDSREYKLMLNATKFGGAPATAIAQFEQKLATILAGALKDKFKAKPSEQRRIVFRDTDKCALTLSGHSLRERSDLEGGAVVAGSREMTLKLRTPDIVIAVDAVLEKEDPQFKHSKFEEDIAPLLLRKTVAGKEILAPSMRSQFSVSIDAKGASEPATFGDVLATYPGLPARLAAAGTPKVETAAALVAGDTFDELVFEGAKLELGGEKPAGIDLSLWYPKGTIDAQAPRLAELSFKYKMKNVENAEAVVARTALRLFQALQRELGEWASAEQESKTFLALPNGC
jgi:hypothetical protein